MELPRLEQPISNGRVALRSWTEADVPVMTERLNDPEIARWTRVPHPYTRAHAEAYLAQMEERRRVGRELALAAVNPDNSGELLGALNLRITSWEHRRAEYGAAFFANARGRGVASPAGPLLARYAFTELGIERIEVLLEADNVAVNVATERAGFTREAVLRNYLDRGGRRVDLVVWSLLPGEA